MSEKEIVVETTSPSKSEKKKASRKNRKKGKAKKKEINVPFALIFNTYKSAGDLEKLGLPTITKFLMSSGLKCGGGLQDRAKKLFLLKDKKVLNDIPSKNYSNAVKKSITTFKKTFDNQMPQLLLLTEDDGELIGLGMTKEISEECDVYCGLTSIDSVIKIGVYDSSTEILTKVERVEPEKKKKKKLQEQEEEAIEYPYDTENDDHCETEKRAYVDIIPLLNKYAALIGKAPAKLKIYDPYFCNGLIKKNFAELGFLDVYNEKEDCYAKWAIWEDEDEEEQMPDFDCVVTNPPYSADHLQKIIEFCCKFNKPWFLLVPYYVYGKDFYPSTLEEHKEKVFYIVPNKRYYYWTPKPLRRNRHTHGGSLGERTSPFITFWYCGLKKYSPEVSQWWFKKNAKGHCTLARNIKTLPAGVKIEAQNERQNNDGKRSHERRHKRTNNEKTDTESPTAKDSDDKGNEDKDVDRKRYKTDENAKIDRIF